ncbi:MAG: thioesterase family protein [Bacteroidales bacterium]
MIISYTNVRARYADVDLMGYVYYGNYATYYEVGRTNALRELGTSYKIMEANGIIMPVHSLYCRFVKPAHYDDLLRVKTIVPEMPAGRMSFEYEICNEQEELLNTGKTVLAFLSKKDNKVVRIPAWFEKLLLPYF